MIAQWFNRIMLTLFCCLAALCMAALGILLMDQPDMANVAYACWFCVFVFVLLPIIDVMENPMIRRRHDS
jgi:hypothetical protein